MEFTGERVVLGSSDADIEGQHIARYRYAARFAEGKTVLDVACGTGYGSAILITEGRAKQYLGLDCSNEAVGFANKHYKNEAARFFVGNAEELSFEGVDLIVSFETLEHLLKPDEFLKNCAQSLSAGGLLIISTPNLRRFSPGKFACEKPANQWHQREYTKRQFQRILRKYFSAVELYGQGNADRYHSCLTIQVALRVARAVVRPGMRLSIKSIIRSHQNPLRQTSYQRGRFEIHENKSSAQKAMFLIALCGCPRMQ